MEPRRTARRSASHGALHSAYSSHTRPPPPPFGPLRPPSHCRSLRSVKENVSFLTSPGPLESMLKTTTETGDIGIFSIGAPGPRRHAGQYPPRASTGISESNVPRRSEMRESDSGRFLDDRRRLPSYRDTTSEILSLYGSESHNSAYSSSLSRRLDDRGPRSYSLTSYGSRRAQNSMSSSNVRTHSGGGLQRPRSPFPYPTRLKRPGVRPSSPALTENGVDYSRMVGVDHVSYRTIHGSYKPFYPGTIGRIPHGVLGPDASPSIRPTPNYGTYPSRTLHEFRGPHNHGATWGPGPDLRERATSGSSNQTAARTSSLTSIIDKYRHSPLVYQPLRPPLSSGPFYYDYTEEFEDLREDIADPPSPLVLARMRPPSTRNPIALEKDPEPLLANNEDGENQHSTPTPGRGRQVQPQQRCSGDPTRRDIDSHLTSYPAGTEYLDHQDYSETGTRTPTTAFRSKSALDSLSRSQDQYLGGPSGSKGSDALLLSENLSAASKSPERQVEIQSPGKTTIRSVRATILGADDQQPACDHSLVTDPGEIDTNRSSRASLASGVETEVAEAKTEPTHDQSSSLAHSTGDSSEHRLSRRSKKFYSLDPGLSDLASLVGTFDRAGRSLLASDLDVSGTWPQSETRDGAEASEIAHASLNASSCVGTITGVSVHSASIPRSKGDPITKPYQMIDPRERGGFPSLKLDTGREAPDAASICNLWPAPSVTPLLAPKPISPAKELRVKNSIPQLMKALPPLPSDLANTNLTSPDTSGSDFEVPTRYSPINLSAFSSPPPRSTSGNEPHTMDLDEHFQRTHDETQLEPKSPRFKVRMKHSTSGSQGTMESRPWNKDKYYPWTENNPDIQLASIRSDSPRHMLRKPRIKLKVSRNAPATDSNESLGTVKRCTVAEKSAAVSDITLQHSGDLFGASTTGFHIFPRPPTPPPTREVTLSSASTSTRPSPLCRLTPRDPIISSQGISSHTSRGASLDTHLQAVGVSCLPVGETPSDQDTLHSEKGHFKRRKALKKKFSNLKRKLSRVHLVESESSHDETPPSDRQAEPVGLAFSGQAMTLTDSHGHAVKKRSIDTKTGTSGRFRHKLSRWMREARRAVHACVRKRRVPIPERHDAS